MAGARLVIDGSTAPVLAVLNELIRRGQDLREPFAAVGEYLRRSHDERWARGVDAAGDPWADLNPDYQARKPKHADKVLVLEGYLRDSLLYQADADSLEFGTNSIYGATHQFGAEERGIPARPFLGLSDEDEAEILAIFSDYFDAA
jgi:phage virion morphogenesis protein